MLNLMKRGHAQSQPEIRAADALRPSRDVLTARQDGMTVLLDLRREVFLGIDEVGSTIWQGIERGATRAEIEYELERMYDAPPEVLRSDARRFVDDLLERRLVVRA
ncbi:MAG: PqqD family protein [Gemmatimonadota bacterium]